MLSIACIRALAYPTQGPSAHTGSLVVSQMPAARGRGGYPDQRSETRPKFSEKARV